MRIDAHGSNVCERMHAYVEVVVQQGTGRC